MHIAFVKLQKHAFNSCLLTGNILISCQRGNMEIPFSTGKESNFLDLSDSTGEGMETSLGTGVEDVLSDFENFPLICNIYSMKELFSSTIRQFCTATRELSVESLFPKPKASMATYLSPLASTPSRSVVPMSPTRQTFFSLEKFSREILNGRIHTQDAEAG